MNVDIAFSTPGILAMVGWLILLASPLIPTLSNQISGFVIPLLLSVGYVILIAFSGALDGTGFGTVLRQFNYPDAALLGWVHFLAFDLFIGAWECRTARVVGMRFSLVIPCLILTYLLGPLGLLVFFGLRAFPGVVKSSTVRGANPDH